MPGMLFRIIRNIYRKLPFRIGYKCAAFYVKYRAWKVKPIIIKSIKDAGSFGYEDILQYLTNNPVVQIPYDWIKKYDPANVIVYMDTECKLMYVMYNNYRLYYPENYSKKLIQQSYAGLLLEQDELSPHKYESSAVSVRKGDIIADIGASEGIFTLSVIDKISMAYLFEADSIWEEPLKKTFKPWKDKICIINKFVSNVTDVCGGGYYMLDDFFSNKSVNFIKADIEGAESNMLFGAKKLLHRHNLSFAICTYHNKDDAENFRELFEQNFYITEFSREYMIFLYNQKIEPPYLRHGVIRAKKKETV
jgi:hypothetical protein